MLLGVETVLPRMVSLATEGNRRGRSISSGDRPLVQDQLNPCRPPEKAKWMRLASVFAGQTRTNQPSCAAAPVAGTPTSSAIRDARKNARIRPPALLNSIDYRLWPNNATILTQNRLALAGEASVSVGHRRQRLPGATRRTHPMRIYIIGNDYAVPRGAGGSR